MTDTFEDDDDDLLAVAVDEEYLKKTSAAVSCPTKITGGAALEKGSVPQKFPFPFEPYEIQKDLMKQLYLCLQEGKVGIFESPTGTGKSLSLICGALTWLRDLQDKQKTELEAATNESYKMNGNFCGEGELDWVAEFSKKKELEDKLSKAKQEQEVIQRRENKLKAIRSSSKVTRTKRKVAATSEDVAVARQSRHAGKVSSEDVAGSSCLSPTASDSSTGFVQLEDDFDDLLKGACPETKKAFNSEIGDHQSSDASLKSVDDDSSLIPDDYESEEEKSVEWKEDEDEDFHITKIYYCSRTHSQLAQFVREIIKSPFGEDARVISLGSRQNLCVNEAVRKLKSVSFINDRCLELQQKKSKKNPGCPYRKQAMLEDFRDKALTNQVWTKIFHQLCDVHTEEMLDVCDIEQLVAIGRQTKTCPYYGSRLAIACAEVVVLPYNTLLHKSTREASGVKLAGNIVIIDEAHNLLETINSVHSVEITGAQLLRAHSQLSQYEAKYRSRLKAKNLMYVKQVLFVLSSLVRCLGGKTGAPAEVQNIGKADFTDSSLMTINSFLFEAKIDNLNLFKIMEYCRCSQISKKLNGFVEKYQVAEVMPANTDPVKETATIGVSKFLQEIGKAKTLLAKRKEDGENLVEQSCIPAPVLNSPLMHIETFLQALTTANDDGRVVVNKHRLLSQCSIKFLLLNPAVHFADVLREARAVVVAGGTMQPVSEFKDQLFFAAGLSPDRVLEFSCGHVIPSENLLALTLATGPAGRHLDFTFQKRDNPLLLEELGRVVVNLCSIVAGGIVLFFPSYDYKQLVFTSWEKSGILARIEAKKKIFREPKSAILVEQVLSQYGDCIKRCQHQASGGPTGAILMCVVGGKMSEGINFSDDLGRCVLMVGMPYPNVRSPELKEKMDYLSTNFPRDEMGRPAGQVHYENLCMKAVNQSIGRAIRHRDDYAVIILADQRYARTSVSSKLPGWIKEHVCKMETFPPAIARISKDINHNNPSTQPKW